MGGAGVLSSLGFHTPFGSSGGITNTTSSNLDTKCRKYKKMRHFHDLLSYISEVGYIFELKQICDTLIQSKSYIQHGYFSQTLLSFLGAKPFTAFNCNNLYGNCNKVTVSVQFGITSTSGPSITLLN